MDPRRLFSSPTSSSPLETFSAEFSSIHFHTFNFRLPMLSGISPEIKFEDKFKALRLERRVIEVGIGPLMRLSDKSMNVRFEWKDFGMFPERLAWEMVRETMSCMFPRMTNSPEVETGTEETVMSVRLTRRARESPERRGKEETAEKEWSESGR